MKVYKVKSNGTNALVTVGSDGYIHMILTDSPNTFTPDIDIHHDVEDDSSWDDSCKGMAFDDFLAAGWEVIDEAELNWDFDDYEMPLDAIYEQKANNDVWYAVMMDADDTDWGTGSFDLSEAKAMAAEYRANGHDDAYIAVIDDGDDPTCIDEIREF